MGLNRTAANSAESIPVGTVLAMAAPTVPVGFLECSGATVSRTTYSALFSLIGTTYGAGDGSTTFTLPNLRGEFIRGWDNGRGVDSGRAYGVFQDRDSASAGSHSHGGVTTGGGGTAAASLTIPLNNQPRNIAMYYIIKY